MAKPLNDAPHGIFPTTYSTAATLDTGSLYNIAAAHAAAARFRGKNFITQVYGHSDNSSVTMLDVSTNRRLAHGRFSISPNITHIAYEVKFLVANVRDEADATLNHRIRVWDGGAATTGWVETGDVAYTTFRAERMVTATTTYTKGKSSVTGWQILESGGAAALGIGAGRRVPHTKWTNHRAVRTNNTALGRSMFDWPYQTVRGVTATTAISSNLSTGDLMFIEVDVIGASGLTNSAMYRPLCVVVWGEVEDDGT